MGDSRWETGASLWSGKPHHYVTVRPELVEGPSPECRAVPLLSLSKDRTGPSPHDPGTLPWEADVGIRDSGRGLRDGGWRIEDRVLLCTPTSAIHFPSTISYLPSVH